MNKNHLITLIFIKGKSNKEIFRYTTYEPLLSYVFNLLDFSPIVLDTVHFSPIKTCFVKVNNKTFYGIKTLSTENVKVYVKNIFSTARMQYKLHQETYVRPNTKIEICYKSEHNNLSFICRLNKNKYKRFISEICKEFNISSKVLTKQYLEGLKKKEFAISAKDILTEQEFFGLKKLYKDKNIDEYIQKLIFNIAFKINNGNIFGMANLEE